VINVVTPATDTGPDTTPPAAPTNLTVAESPAGSVLTWSAATDNVGVTGYNIYRYDRVFATLVARVTGTSYTGQFGSSPYPGSPLSVFVRARDAAGNVSLASNLATVSGTSGPSTPPSSSPPPPAPLCRASYLSGPQWTGGFLADVEVTNTSQVPVSGWTVTFQFGGDQRIVTAWNAGFDQAGTAVTLTDARWNSVIPAGGSVKAGLYGRWTVSNTPPTAVSLNGAPCAVG
jgi:hypothetical protein